MIDVHRLRIFRSVVASGSVQAAAQHLGYTSSAVSQHITALQRETGLQLFEKAGRGLTPTTAGRLLASESEDAMAALARLDEVVDSLRSGRTGHMSIACFASAGEEWIPTVAQALQREFTELLLSVDLQEITVRPTSASADVEIRTELPDDGPHLVPAGYTRIPLTTEPYVVVVPNGHRLAERGSVRFSDLAGEAWVDESQTEQVCGRIMAQCLRSAGINPRYVAHCQDHHTAMALAAAGIGITLVPRLTLGSLPPGVRALAITDPEPRRGIAVLVRDTSSSSPAVIRAVELLRDIAGVTAG